MEGSSVERDEVERAIHTLRGVKVIFDTTLADWFGMQVLDLHDVVQKNKNLLPDFFVFRLDEVERAPYFSKRSGRESENEAVPSFAFTLHGILLFSGCLDQSEATAFTPRIVLLMGILNDDTP